VDLTLTLLAVTLTTSPWNGLRIRPTAFGSTPHPPTAGRVNAHRSATAATHAVAVDAFIQRLLLCWPLANARILPPLRRFGNPNDPNDFRIVPVGGWPLNTGRFGP
jgi:hypothetical protein